MESGQNIEMTGVQVTARAQVVPLQGYESTTISFQGQVQLFITPSEQATLKVHFLERRVIQEPVKLPHESSIQPVIVFVFRMIDHIEISHQ
jgi:hypothetical protein